MAGISTYLAEALLDHIIGGDAYAQPAALYLALYTTNPTAADAGTEVSGTGYARQAITFEAADAAATENDAAVVFPAAEADWGTVTHWGIRDADSAGNLLLFGAVTTSKAVTTGDVAKVNLGDLDLSLA